MTCWLLDRLGSERARRVSLTVIAVLVGTWSGLMLAATLVSCENPQPAGYVECCAQFCTQYGGVAGADWAWCRCRNGVMFPPTATRALCTPKEAQ